MGGKHKTPMLTSWKKERGRVSLLNKKGRKKQPDGDDELGQLEKSFQTKRGYWKHGGSSAFSDTDQALSEDILPCLRISALLTSTLTE